jgi:molybdopterin-guanine dinucleotide biosynthesis protein A
MKMGKIPVYILAGGQSRRFGGNKARACIDGQPMMIQLKTRLLPIAEEFVAVAQSQGEYEDLGFRTIADCRPGQGPLAGLEAALADMTMPGWLLLAACDWTGVRPEWIEILLREAAADRTHLEGICFRDDRPQPLLAIYHTRIAPLVGELLHENNLAMMTLIDRMRVRVLPAPPGWDAAKNINSKSQLDRDNVRDFPQAKTTEDSGSNA